MANTFTTPFAQKFSGVAAAVTAAIAGIGTSTVTGAVLLATGAANGSFIIKLTAMPRATVAASSLVLFVVKAAAPTVFNLIDSQLMAAYALAATTQVPVTNFDKVSWNTPIVLGAGDMLYVGSQVALTAGIIFYAEQADM